MQKKLLARSSIPLWKSHGVSRDRHRLSPNNKGYTQDTKITLEQRKTQSIPIKIRNKTKFLFFKI